jgi:hypothetical protein
MKKFCIALGMVYSLAAPAEEMMDHDRHMGNMDHAPQMSMAVNDARELLDYPPEVRAHALANMRGHLRALADIMAAFAQAHYAEAADIADSRLGMDSSGAAGCRPDTMNNMDMDKMSEADYLNHQMALLMPEKMRELGQNMHRSANEFATKARAAAKNRKNAQAAAAALALIPKQCVACHEKYRMQ